MQEFIRQWFRVEVEAESLWSQLQAAGKERIKDLCHNPLRLTLLCSTWKVEDALPETTPELYAGFVESMYASKQTASYPNLLLPGISLRTAKSHRKLNLSMKSLQSLLLSVP